MRFNLFNILIILEHTIFFSMSFSNLSLYLKSVLNTYFSTRSMLILLMLKSFYLTLLGI